MPKQTKPWPPEKRPRPAMLGACRSPANILPLPGVLSYYAGPGKATVAPTWARDRILEQPGASQRSRHGVFRSSHHPAARKYGRGQPLAKQHMPKEIKPHPFSLGQLPGNQRTNAPTE
ncbi:hypothetical protein MRX96_049491 [Rhipicephalus microplus]